MKKYKVGIVIPVYLTKFIGRTIENLSNNPSNIDVVYCIVNDGVSEVKEYLEKIDLPDNMYILNLPTNRCFSGSNNDGWRSLIERYYDIEYLGSLNDDTITYGNWLDEMMKSIEKDTNIAAVAPNVTHKFENGLEYYCHAVFIYGETIDGCMKIVESKISEDKYVKLIGGCCFIARREALEKVGFLDENFKNFCEDVDLSLKFITNGYKMIICGNAIIAHFFGSSRNTRVGHNKDISEAQKYLASKWGNNLSIYN